MKEELNVMQERKVWHLVDLPPNIDPIGCRWVFALKKNETGEVVRYKARLVGQGFKQIKGISYDDTFSPVVNFSLIRFFFAVLVVGQNWVHIQCDIKCAYLYAPLKEDVFMKQPPGFEVKGKEGMVCKLDKALYGLHQSGREWFFEIHNTLKNLGFNKFEWCNCIYSYENDLLLLLYVDDIVFIGRSIEKVMRGIKLLQKYFDLKILGKTRRLLGVEFEEKNEEVFIHQSMYIDEIHRRFSKYLIPFSSLPISKGVVFTRSQCPQTNHEREEMAEFPYRNLLGCLSFLSNRTRPDISYAVNILSQYQNNPGKEHWKGLLRLLGYVKSTSFYQLNLSCFKPKIVAFSDSDFAACRDDRVSMGGQIIFIGQAPIVWRTFKEKCISLSTMEAEFIALTEAAKEMTWFDRILGECCDRKIIEVIKEKPTLYVDNLAAIDFVKSPVENHRSRHIDVKLFFIGDLVYKELFELKYVKSKDNLSDIFTKAPTKHDLEKFVDVVFKKNVNDTVYS
ncbi:Retrovirus-related Pol polyprotein from transposon TNT 1-94 [Araneus ventricosus]|uniref:Retrovirus-related Pol polyprotein from transposon TNT 1-94 n=1 Tax=Araneus ventricosus TaxID=182803 RepID=A0A4Y2H2V2_ARAVE|nr:Retrovirus-related Pol polyprotein from transposon TNT 1-94 [Araneus ventricosus]GBM60410.1 Retrovirus-related Pol polyprotein from transposon TNT 1-94 [Araneus ventricosus]